MICVHSPPVTATEYTFQMPDLFDENRIRLSSEENDAPPMDVVSRNCSIVYCLDGLVRLSAVEGFWLCARAGDTLSPRRVTAAIVRHIGIIVCS